MPIFFPVGWIDVIVLVAGTTLCAWVLRRINRLKRESTQSPWCPRCDYSLYGNPTATTCSECGTDLRVQKPLLFRRGRRTWLTTAWMLAVCITILAATRFTPVIESRFLDFRMTSYGYFLQHPAEEDWESASEVYAWQDGDQWGWMWGWEVVPVGPPFYDKIEMIYRSPKTGDYTQPMQIDPGSLDFRYPSIADKKTITGQSLDAEDILRWYADGGLDSSSPYIRSQAAFVEKVIRGKATNNFYRNNPNDLMEVSYHTPVGSRHPRRSLWTYPLALLSMLLLIRWGRRRIRAVASA